MSEHPARYLTRLIGDISTPDDQIMEAWIEAVAENLFEFGVNRYSAEGPGIVTMHTMAETAREIRLGEKFDMFYTPLAQMEAGIGVWSSALGQVGLKTVRDHNSPTQIILMVLHQGQLYGPYLITRRIDPKQN